MQLVMRYNIISSELWLTISLLPSLPPFPQLIFCREYTHAEDNNWHLDHFCCLRCDVGLGGKQYRPQEGMPYCLSCFEAEFSTLCEVRGREGGREGREGEGGRRGRKGGRRGRERKGCGRSKGGFQTLPHPL